MSIEEHSLMSIEHSLSLLVLLLLALYILMPDTEPE